jgi:hypothetical protein
MCNISTFMCIAGETPDTANPFFYNIRPVTIITDRIPTRCNNHFADRTSERGPASRGGTLPMAQPKEENPRTPHTSGFVVPTLAHKTRKNGAASVELADGEKPGAR